MAVISLATTIKPGPNAQTRQGIAGESISAGEVVYRAASGKFMKAVATSAAAANVAGIALQTSGLDQPLTIIEKGRATGLTGLKPGAVLVLDNLAGDVTDDSATDLVDDTDYVTVVAMVQSATDIEVGIIRGPVLNLA